MFLAMAFELVVHSSEGDIVLGSYETRTAVIAVQQGERWSVLEVKGEARPAAVIDFASYQAKRRARHLKG
jgi:hypothetical protein